MTRAVAAPRDELRLSCVFQRFHGEHEAHEFVELAAAGAVEAVAILWIVVLRPIDGEFVAVAGAATTAGVERQSSLHQPHRPAVNDADRSTRLVFEVAAKRLRPVVQTFGRPPVDWLEDTVPRGRRAEQGAGLVEQGAGRASRLAFAARRPARDPEAEGGQPTRALEPFFNTVSRVSEAWPFASMSSMICRILSGTVVRMAESQLPSEGAGREGGEERV